MNFLKKSWVIGLLVGLVLYSVLIFRFSFPNEKGRIIIDLISLPIFMGIGTLIGLISPFRNLVIKSMFIGSITGVLTGALFDLFVLFSGGAGDPAGTIFILLMAPPFLGGLGAFVGSLVGLSIYIVVRDRYQEER